MAKRARDLPFPALAVDPAASRPLHRQIYFAIREAILAPKFNFGSPRVAATDVGDDGGVLGRSGGGSRLPSRTLTGGAEVVSSSSSSR